ncbi:MAG: HAMP domain-containing histidine kinase, partial [Clostridia bacterium]|nr:HAMP domain-containing histidine kinase [Clostridia bacterium]
MKFDKCVKPKKLHSINAVLIKYFLLLAVFLIVMVEVVCYLIVRNTSEDKARERLVLIGRNVAARVNDQDVEGLIREYRMDGINVYVLSKEGEVLLPVGERADGDWKEEIDGVIKRLSDKVTGSVVYVQDNYMTYAAAVEYQGESYVVATYSLAIINGAARSLLTYFIIVGVVVILATALVSYTISQKLSSGLKNLSSTAVRFSQGDFGVNFANAEYLELADLSDTLNSVRDEVKKSGDLQHEIIANVSHDLKTPLTMIKAYASMIREISGDNPEKRDKHLQVIIDEADRLTGLVNDVLDVSKVTATLDEIKSKVFNLTDFLYGIINKFDYLQETQGYKFMVDIDSGVYTRADEEKIGQVIYNLLGNAVNYTGADKTVYVSLKKGLTEERVRLTVKDTGKGIADKDKLEIWNRYYRAKENHSRPVKGTGLGLNIVKIILENHSFDFGVDSEVGKGSSFWVDFPCVPEE